MNKTIYEALQNHVGVCREWIDTPEHGDRCGKPSEYVLWGKLLPAKGLGPRCYEHASKYVGRSGLMAHSGYALINLRELATDLEELA
jgi:hypothetical protein